MPQEFIAIRCFNCMIFQVQQSKKSSKWTCKMCGEKQSLKKVYGKGTGAQCRQLVQSLNFTNGQLEEEKEMKRKNLSEPPNASQILEELDNGDQQFTRESKWAEFIGEPDDISEEDIPDYSEKFNGKMVTTERPEVKRRGNSRYSTKKRRRSQEVAISAEQRDGGCFDDSEQPLGSKRMAVTSSSEYSFSSAGNFQDRFGGVAMSCQRSNCWRLMNSNVETMFAKETSKYSHPSQILSSNNENCEGTTEGLFQGGKLEVVETKTRKYNNNSDHCSARSKFADKTNNNRVNRHVDSGVVSIRSLQRSENFVQLSDFPRTSDCANQVKDIGAQSQNSKSADKATKVVKKSSKWSDFLDDEDNTIAEEDVYKDERDRKPDSTKGVTIGNAENLFCLQDELDEDFLWTDE